MSETTCVALVKPAGVIAVTNSEGQPSGECTLESAKSVYETAQKVCDNKLRWKTYTPEFLPSVFRKDDLNIMSTAYINDTTLSAYIALIDGGVASRDSVPDSMEIYIRGHQGSPNWMFVYRTRDFPGDRATFQELYDRGTKSPELGRAPTVHVVKQPPSPTGICEVGGARLVICSYHLNGVISSGHVLGGELKGAHGTLKATRQSVAFYYDNGQLKSVDISDDQIIQGVPCAGSTKEWSHVVFYKSGRLTSGRLSREHGFLAGQKMWIELPEGTSFELYESGKLKQFVAPDDVLIKAGKKYYSGGVLIGFDENGNEVTYPHWLK